MLQDVLNFFLQKFEDETTVKDMLEKLYEAVALKKQFLPLIHLRDYDQNRGRRNTIYISPSLAILMKSK